MKIEQIIDQDIRKSMIGKFEERLEALRTIKTSIQIEKSKDGKELSDEQVLKLIQKLVNQRTESVNQYKQGGRSDLADHEMILINIFKTYLPEQLSEEEIVSTIKNIIIELNAKSIKDMGKIMTKANQTFSGRADYKLIGNIVKNLLNN